MESSERKKFFSIAANEENAKKTKEKSGVELRKNKREEIASKYRNLETAPSWVILNNHYPETYTIEELPQILESFQAPDNNSLLYIAQAIRKLLCNKEKNYVSDVCNTVVLQHLPSWLSREDHSQLQYEAAWICTNIASSEQCDLLTKIEAIGPLVNLLRSSRQEIRGLSAWSLGNIAANSTAERNLLMSYNALDLLVLALQTPIRAKDKDNCLWAISNFIRKKPLLPFETIKQAFVVMLQSLDIKSAYPLVDILWAINSYISNPDVTFYLTSPQIISITVGLLSSKDKDIKYMANKIIGGICSSSGIQTQLLLEANVIPGLYKSLHSKSAKIRKESTWAIANICGETSDQIDFILNGKIFERIIECAELDTYLVRSECAWVLANSAAVARPDQIVKLVELGLLKAFVNLLGDLESSYRIVLQALLKVLECGQLMLTQSGLNLFAMCLENNGGFNVIAQLQFHSNKSISNKAIEVMRILHPENLENYESRLVEVVNNDLNF